MADTTRNRQPAPSPFQWCRRSGLTALVCAAGVAAVYVAVASNPGRITPTPTTLSVVPGYVPSPPTPSASPKPFKDTVFDEFNACPPGFEFQHDAPARAKWCTLSFASHYVTQYNVSWGPVCPYLWGGDIGVWVNKDYVKCPPEMPREVVRATRTYCVALLDWRDPSKRPWLQRLEPVCPTTVGDDDMITVGFGVRHATSPERVWTCPESTERKYFCETVQGGTVSPSTGRPVMDSLETVLPRVAVDGRVVMAVASHQYAKLAVAWWAYVEFMGYHGAMVVAMDPVAYAYLHNRGVPVALMEAIMPLDPCCLRRFRMIPFRMTNDVKPRALATAVRLGYKTMMMDMDVRMWYAPDWESWDKVSLMEVMDHSFMWTYVQPSPATFQLWETVLHGVYTGGWDQAVYKYEAKRAAAAEAITVGTLDQRKYASRMQNQELLALHRFGSAITPAWVHPDMTGVSRYVAWPDGSPCSRHADDATHDLDWPLWRACAMVLIHAAVRLDRTAILEPANHYAFSEMSNWFPVIQSATVQAFGTLPKSLAAFVTNTLTTKDLERSTPPPFQTAPLVYLAVGDPRTEVDFVRLHSTAAEWQRLNWYVLPNAPDRLQFKCMRNGGPPTTANPNPDQSCRGPTGDEDLMHPKQWPLQWPAAKSSRR